MTMRKNHLQLWVVAATCFAATGCMPKMTLEEMKASQPQRPAELERLNIFVGTWEMTGEMTFAGLDEPLKTSGTATGKWAGDGWFIVSDSVFRMGELGDMHSHEAWTYDAHSKRYRSTWVDSMGAIASGTAKYDEKTKTWTMRSKSHGPYGGSTGKGSAVIIDDNTMEWQWSEYAMGGLMKVMEMKGTSRRK